MLHTAVAALCDRWSALIERRYNLCRSRPHADQAVGPGGRNAHHHEESNPVRFAGKVDRPVARRTSDRLAEPRLKPLDQHLELTPDQSLVPARLDYALPFLYLGQSRRLLFFKDRV